MAAEVTVDLREIDAVKKILARAALDPDERGRLLQSVGLLAEKQTRGRFDTRRDPDGNPWKALSQRTAEYYVSKGMGHRSILIGTGMLQGSITREVGGGGRSVLVGATMEYAATHQFGATVRPRTAKAPAVPGFGMLRKATIPARPYLGVSREDAEDIAALAAAFAAGRIQ